MPSNQPVAPQINKRSLIAGFSGNILEWYDFTVYGFFATLVCTWLVKVSGGNVMMPAYYLIATAVFALVTVRFLPETYKAELK